MMTLHLRAPQKRRPDRPCSVAVEGRMYPAVARAERVLWPIRCKCNRGPDLLVVPRAVEDVIAHVVMRLLAGAHAFISETKTCRHQSFPAKADIEQVFVQSIPGRGRCGTLQSAVGLCGPSAEMFDLKESHHHGTVNVRKRTVSLQSPRPPPDAARGGGLARVGIRRRWVDGLRSVVKPASGGCPTRRR